MRGRLIDSVCCIEGERIHTRKNKQLYQNQSGTYLGSWCLWNSTECGSLWVFVNPSHLIPWFWWITTNPQHLARMSPSCFSFPVLWAQQANNVRAMFFFPGSAKRECSQRSHRVIVLASFTFLSSVYLPMLVLVSIQNSNSIHPITLPSSSYSPR